MRANIADVLNLLNEKILGHVRVTKKKKKMFSDQYKKKKIKQ